MAEYEDRDIQRVLSDGDMIRNHRKIRACIENAKTFRDIVAKCGSFQNYVDQFEATKSGAGLERLRKELQSRFAGLGEIVTYHYLTDMGMPVLKPDRVIVRIFTRLGLIPANASPNAVVEEGRKFAAATGHPIRYIDIVFVAYGQVQTRELGIERGICLEVDPSCSICGVRRDCKYHAGQAQE